MSRNRSPLLAAAALLALPACGSDESEREKREGAAAPLGFELAMAGTAGTGDASAAPAPAPMQVIDLSPEELAARIAAGNVRLIDVRTDAEVAEGTIPGATGPIEASACPLGEALWLRRDETGHGEEISPVPSPRLRPRIGE